MIYRNIIDRLLTAFNLIIRKIIHDLIADSYKAPVRSNSCQKGHNTFSYRINVNRIFQSKIPPAVLVDYSTVFYSTYLAYVALISLAL